MRILIFLLLTTLASLANAAQPEKFIDVQHDAHRGVTCWILNDTAISCLPDSQLQRQQASTANDESSTCAKSQVGTSAPAIREEVFQL